VDPVERESFSGMDPGALVDAVDHGERIPLAPVGLNENIRGGMLRGHHALLFGQNEVGKSLFAINALVAACRANYRGGYWENEDPIVATQLRAACCASYSTEEQVKAGGKRRRKALEQAGWYHRMFFRDSAGGTLYDIDKWVGDFQLDFIVVNQLRNIQVKSENRVLELETISKGLRAIAKSRNIAVLSVTQAADSGFNKRVLQMGDVDWSNVGVQAACDLMIGFGTDDLLESQNQRMLSLCKNKLGRTHDPVLVGVDIERSLII